ncbi:uncharacterized protein LOC126837022 [Adelges cooleyi]|uniref:uncharacterized protein LOC126837022 n=1 Tax=Adelges cooleyi TaxID=133065 RepID=UPI00217F9BE8|nr:uncharacterized protein LOC126837022 [Adelges cooleyi]
MDHLLPEGNEHEMEVEMTPVQTQSSSTIISSKQNQILYSENLIPYERGEMGYKIVRRPSPTLKTSDQYKENTMRFATFPHYRVPANLTPKLQNIVSTVDMGCRLDLKAIALQSKNSEFDPTRISAVIMRIREPRTTALIFSSGKLVVTGAKSETDSKLAARKFAKIIQKLNFPAKFLNFKIQNIVGSCDVEFIIRLEKLDLAHRPFSSYEPELFPGIIFRMIKPRVVVLIFATGKIIITGAKVRQEIVDAFENIYPILKSNRGKWKIRELA